MREHDTIPLTHMGPPLRHGSAGGPVHAIGTVPLSVDEIQQINVFVDELYSEYKAHNARNHRQYVIRPHVWPERDSDGTVLFLRFNCAGFVIEAYRAVGIDLVRTADNEIPWVSLGILVTAYPELAPYLQNASFRDSYDLPGDGPWPVILPGYVLNALERQEDVIRSGIPYHAVPGDEYYPSRR